MTITAAEFEKARKALEEANVPGSYYAYTPEGRWELRMPLQALEKPVQEFK